MIKEQENVLPVQERIITEIALTARPRANYVFCAAVMDEKTIWLGKFFVGKHINGTVQNANNSTDQIRHKYGKRGIMHGF